MASKSELEAVIKLAGNIDPSLRKALLDAQRRIGDVGKTSSMTGKLISKAFTVAATGVAVGITAIGAGLLYVAKQGLDLASDLTEVQNVVDVTFGKGATQINAWSKQALQAYGLSELSAKRYSSTLGALMKSSGVSSENLISMSENLTALSGDFASFYNLDPAEAFEKIKSGISGETEPLKALGINMSVANLEAFALAKGIKTAWSKMGQGDQTMLRYNFLLEKSADAQGDFARTIGSYANQKRLFSEGFKQLSSTIMNAALPAFTSLFKKGNEMVSAFANSPEKIKKLQDAIAGVANKIIVLIPIALGHIQNITGFLGDLYNSAVPIYQYISDNWSLIGPIILGIVAAIAAWKLAMGIISTVKTLTIGINALKIAFDFLRISKLKDAATTLYLTGLYAKDTIVKGFNTAGTWAMNAANKASRIGLLAAAAAQWVLNAAVYANPITWIVIGIVAAVALLVGGIILLVKYWDNVINAMKNAWTWFHNLINKIPDLALVLTGPIAPMLLLIKHWGAVKDFLTNSWQIIKMAFAMGVNIIVDNINWLIEKMNKIPGVNIDLIPRMDTSAYTAAANSIPTHGMMMQEFAKGGFANQPSIFGEAGPEAAIPLKRTPRSLSLLSKTAEVLGVGGGGTTGSGSGPTFVYSPTYGSNTSESQVRQDFEEFKAMCNKWVKSMRRENFA
ncbi:hypothetical protein EHS13_20280 [Paenibacillus psychroresistens]|uniref:Phage tail tape measure protein n=1 Tax=Paenibacillus psychroresistens TaxID=1778678 RepID=A0A6B8RMJ1_9BACL|nr:hypothetical protein [Paenibacillus psychroresistens]QGQ97057.1 hypothetical protein EHS13_20280 [Paenibacillus psychroresistens]